MAASPQANLGLYAGYADGEEPWGASMNRNLRELDALVQASVKDKDLLAPPGTPTTGDCYIVGAPATGGWAGKETNIARYSGTTWDFYVAHAGWKVWVADESKDYRFSGSAWADVSVAALAADTDPTLAANSDARLPTQKAVKAYVDAKATGVSYKGDVVAATLVALPANTYANGTAGVGATLTGNANGALSAQDGVTLTAGQALLVKNEATGQNNGRYVLTQVGSAGTPYILTRATDSDTDIELTNATMLVTGGTQVRQQWNCNTPSITVGTTPLNFVKVSLSGGDASTSDTVSVDSEIALFSGTTGKLLKRTAGTGYAKLVAGVLSILNALQLANDLQGDGLTSKQAGFRNIPQNSQTGDYTTVAGDSGAMVFHPVTATTACAWTIAANSSVAYPIGTAITFINQRGAGTVTISAGGTDVLNVAGTVSATGSRALAANGWATAVKITATEWIISGVGLT